MEIYQESVNYYEKALNLCSTNNYKTKIDHFKLSSYLASNYIMLNNCEKVSFYLIYCLNITENNEQMILYLKEIIDKYIRICGKDIPLTGKNGIDQYVETLLKNIAIPGDVSEILFNFGKLMSNSENSKKSIELLRLSLKFLEESDKFNNKLTQIKKCEIYNILGIENDKIKNYEESFECFSKTLKIRKKTLGADHIKTAGAYNNVAIALDKLNKLVDSLENCKKCMEIRLKKLPLNDIKIANSFYNLSIILFKMMDHEEAIKYMHMSLSIYNEKLGSENSFSADTSMKLGEIYRITNKLDKAETFLENAIKIYTMKHKSYKSNENYLRASCLLGCVYSENKKFDLSIKILDPIINDVRTIFGNINLTAIDALFELGICFYKMKDYETSYKYLNEVNSSCVIKVKWSEKRIKYLNKKLYQVVIKAIKVRAIL